MKLSTPALTLVNGEKPFAITADQTRTGAIESRVRQQREDEQRWRSGPEGEWGGGRGGGGRGRVVCPGLVFDATLRGGGEARLQSGPWTERSAFFGVVKVLRGTLVPALPATVE